MFKQQRIQVTAKYSPINGCIRVAFRDVPEPFLLLSPLPECCWMRLLIYTGTRAGFNSP